MRDGKRGDEQYQGTQLPERNNQAEDKKQVIRSIEDVQKAHHDETPRSLMPPWIERDYAGIPVQLEGTRGARNRNVLQRRHDPQAKSREPRLDGECGAIRSY